MFNWIESLRKKLFGVPSRPARRVERRSTRLSLEVLEDRTVPTPLVVTNLSGDPSVVGSLPNEVAQATPQNNTVYFEANLTGVIPLSATIEVGAKLSGLTIEGSGANITISGQNETRIFQVDPNMGLTLNNLTLTNGEAPPASNSDGSALLVLSGAAVNLNNDTFSNNTANGNSEGFYANGGAIENDGLATIMNCTFSNNTAYGNGGAIENFGDLEIQGGIFSNNAAYSTRGGAIDSGGGGDGMLNLQGVTFQQNKAQGGNGGAIASNDPVTLSNKNQFNTNKAVQSDGVGGSGGAIYYYGSSASQLQDGSSTYAGNTASVNGGAIDTAGQTTMAGDTFQDNQALSGSGGAIMNEASNQTTIQGSGFTDNAAQLNGGAIENLGSLNVGPTNGPSVFIANVAGTNGGAIDSNALSANAPGTLSASSCWFDGNQATNGAGGAINTADSTALTNDSFNEAQIQGKLFPNTAATRGGAVNATGGQNGLQVIKVFGSEFVNNQVTGKDGIGGAIATAANTMIVGCNFTGNQLTGNGTPEGGAIAYFISNNNAPATPIDSELFVSRSFFQNNQANTGATSNGGAISSHVSANAGTYQVTVQTSTFQGNQAGNEGGGVFVNHFVDGTASISTEFTNDTFYENQAPLAGAIELAALVKNLGATGTNTASLTCLTVYANTSTSPVDATGAVDVGSVDPGTVSFHNNILDGNTVLKPGYAGPLDVTETNAGDVTDLGWNLLDPSDSDTLQGEGDLYNESPGLANALAPNNALPGYPQTLALAAGSPALGAGDPSLAGTIDERGRTRQPNNVSMGAEDPNAT